MRGPEDSIQHSIYNKQIMQASTSPIIVDLDQSDNSREIAASGLIQQENLRKITAEIRRDLSQAKISRENRYPSGAGFVYFIDGTRGAGKSTFLHSLFRSFEDLGSIAGHSIGAWTYIDPSRIEASEIILLPLLKELKRQVWPALSLRKQNGAHLEAEFRRQFQDLAGGLSLLAQGKNHLKDLDPELFLDWGLERAGHGLGFREKLHDLIETACQILKVDALALAFDDADTKFDSAIDVLEVIRKYLDTPRLIVLVTGDFELYSQLTRDVFHDRLGSRATIDKRRDAQRLKMIDHLEDQYLLKLFPIRRRIQLRPMWNLLAHNEFVLVSERWPGSQRQLKSVVNELMQRGLRIRGVHDLNLFYEFLLKQPLRSVLQVLSRCAAFLSTADAEGDVELTWDSDLSTAVSDSLRAIALGNLYKFNVDVDAISAGEMPALVEAVFDLTVQDEDYDTAYLRPQPTDAALKSCFATLAAEVALFCVDQPSALLQYMLGGPGSIATYGQFLQRLAAGSSAIESNQELFRAKFKKYLGIGRKEDALHWAWHATAILAGPQHAATRRPLIDFGVIGLNKNARNSNEVTATAAIQRCLIDVGDLPVLALSLVDVSGSGGRLYASIYNILGLLDRVLRIEIDNPEFMHERVAHELARVFKTPTISRPGWEGSAGTDDGYAAIDLGPTKELSLAHREREGISRLASRVAEWLIATERLRAQIKPSAILIGKIWTRLFFSLERVSANRRGKVGVPELMELFALCVINAFLVEEMDHRLPEDASDLSQGWTRIDRSNPLTSRKIVTQKFEAEHVNAHVLPLTFLVASSPLIQGLLSSETQHNEMLDKLTMETDLPIGSFACHRGSWHILRRSRIAGPKNLNVAEVDARAEGGDATDDI
ncbi:hypothetical protein AWB69_00724 [Caballeronia udeis]|uniref:KAP NTPase domain-containing protein n=1 Tax=Caballeronia udeis TaxID=1232866 RepID=A0A158F6C5_9BURK|nr:hypothetical protein [Caballeronia udeis]SAL15426.1 hypothetical protein AWB69_00724 [Caballeronia udeis]